MCSQKFWSSDAITARTFEGDPYAALVLADAPGSAELEVAARVSGLVPFATEWWQHTVFYVDQTEDPEGNHRVYVRDEDSLPGLPEFSLPSVAALARGWAQAAGGDTEVAWERLVDDDWEEGPTSGSFVLETMVRGSLSSQWAMAGVGAFMPSRPELADQPLPVGADAPGRTLCLHALRVVRLAGELPLPQDLVLAALAPEHREYLEHLKELERVARVVEDKYREIRSIRFTIENKRLWLNDQRAVMAKSTQAVIQTLLDLRRRKVVDDEYAVKNVEPGQLNEILHPIVDVTSVDKLKSLEGGVSGAPGAAIGRVFFTTDALLEEYKLAQQRQSDARLILCMGASYAEDVKAIEVATGVLSSEGGYAAHASVVARQYGKVSLVRNDMTFSGNKATIGNVTIKEGDYVTLSVAFFGDPVIYLGKAALIEPDPETSGLLEYLGVVDQFVEEFHVRANADTPRDATLAYNFGAGGIGLCRTEHMFFAEDRINVFRQLIMASSLEERRKVLAKLLPMQRKDFYGLFKAMKGRPVTIRLMDAPLHEFLPHNAGEMKNFLNHLNAGRKTKISQKEVELLSESLHEFNPMLGHRGCRLSVSYPEIYEMQMRAIFEAAFKLQKEKVRVHPEIMVPLIMNDVELKLIIFGKKIEGSSIKGLVDVEEEVRKAQKARPIPFTMGTMIELPVAALSAGKIARYAQFFSFGTNDLTQTTMGLSRDDYTSFMPDYTLYDILDSNPFQVLNPHVKELVAIAAKRGRLTRPDLKAGLCGEHGAIPENIQFCMEAGLDYVSCSSYSVPIAKLAVAQLNLGM